MHSATSLKSRFGGLTPATLTPFSADGSLSEAGIDRHVASLLEAGITTLAPGGTTGEVLYLSLEEKRRLLSSTIRVAGGAARVIAGVWDLSVAGIAELARHAEAAGADAVFLTPPIYYPSDDDAIRNWYGVVRANTGLPLFAYNIPQYAVNGIGAALFRRMLAEGIVQGIKDSTGKASGLTELLGAAGEEGMVFAASDSFVLEAARLGAHGFISAIANVYPRTCLRAWGGDEAAQRSLDAVRAAIKRHGGLAALKALLCLRGLGVGGSRLPFADPDAAAVVALQAELAAVPDLA